MEHVLGKVSGGHPTQGGPDAMLDIVVTRRWLSEGRTIEVDLPRHLLCAACQGAGCDICGQSGAITVRERSEPPEVLRITLPRHDLDAGEVPESQRSIQLRITGRGGLPESGVWPSQRGRLLLRIGVAGTLSECVREVPEDQVVSSSTISRADYVSSQAKPTSSVSTVTSAAEPKRTAEHALDWDIEDVQSEAPATRRSLEPTPARSLPLRAPSTKSAKKQPPRRGSSRLWGRIAWRDVAIGLLVMLLGAALAWFLV